ncbi:STAS domain-containing protein [Streptomyces sp. NPDC060011]|nr:MULTISPECIES: STAS domain-containing protein [unclassified Streptomyces]NEB35120.1 STAS domain-containing protein [Streptomyces sp. SID14446]MCX5134413.1 STAS domain-containing protein [Streptomyces sp. NBC_00340]MCX5281441.1 STAS domain-containing protein [Streptomyces sp. NBC_00198]WSD75394.1 STAS domain-containing protein [Streptomyces sp. NBC_01558]WSK58806.1 STAS domain-containing protein [Streptomyces sp. NBC_01281]
MFSIEVRSTAPASVLVVRGELDFDSVVQLDEAADRLLDEADGQGALVVVDCTALDFCDSSGIGCFVRIYQRLAAHGGELRLAAVPATVARAFSLTGLDQAIGVHGTMEAALASGSGGHGPDSKGSAPSASLSAER